MIEVNEDYCYFIRKNKLVFLLISEIIDEEHIYVNAEFEKYKCSLIDKKVVYYYSKRYYRYELSISEKIDITYKHTVAFDRQELVLDNAQFFKTEEFSREYVYKLNDLGITYNSKYVSFKIWSPIARKMFVLIFDDEETEKYERYELSKTDAGIWRGEVEGALLNKCYLFEGEVFGETIQVLDIYSKAITPNGKRTAIISLQDTDPEDFREHKFMRKSYVTDTIIYEAHIEEFTKSETSGVTNKGTYLGFTEKGTKNSNGDKTGIDHILEVGANYVQFLPFFSVDKNDLKKTYKFQSENYNVPEGSYSSNPNDTTTRIKELKTMIMNLHKNGIGVFMDISFTSSIETKYSNYQKLVPNFYFRTDNFGNFTNATGHGNELATERYMVSKHFIDTIVFWAKEYRIDGFRFTNLKLHDIHTINRIRMALDRIDTKIIVYGDDYSRFKTPLSVTNQTIKKNAKYVSTRVAFMSKDLKKGLKDTVLSKYEEEKQIGSPENIKFAIVGAVPHKDINIKKVIGNKKFWAKSPTQVVNYVTMHYNRATFWDKLLLSSNNQNEAELVKFNKLTFFCLAISQGGLLIQSGEEFGRTKIYEYNGYKNYSEINSINWDKKGESKELLDYYKGLIELRQKEPGFRLRSQDEVNDNIEFLISKDLYVVAKIKSLIPEYSHYLAFVNATPFSKVYTFEKNRTYYKIVDGQKCERYTSILVKKMIEIKPYECILLVTTKELEAEDAKKTRLTGYKRIFTQFKKEAKH